MSDFYEKSGFRFNNEDGCISFIQLDTPLYKNQLNTIVTQLDDVFDDGTEFEKFVYHTVCEDIEYDGYGSLRLVWNRKVCDWLTESQLADMQLVMDECFQETEWFGNWSTMHSMEQEGIEELEQLESYCDAVRQCGYTMDWDATKDLCVQELHQEFDKYRTLQILKAAA